MDIKCPKCNGSGNTIYSKRIGYRSYEDHTAQCYICNGFKTLDKKRIIQLFDEDPNRHVLIILRYLLENS